jgi:hypothetical protein
MSVAGDLQKLFAGMEVKNFNAYSQGVFQKLSQCQTASAGYHLYRCSEAACNKEKMQYHCCGNRHCPNCGSMKKEAWIEERTSELLPTAYYHVVFTMPHEWNAVVPGNRKIMFKILFEAASETLLNYGKNPEFLGAQPGITMVLHTWRQQLSFHPHVHCIVSGGGFANGKWINPKRTSGNFIFPVSGLRKMYKAIFLKKVRQSQDLQIPGIDITKLIGETGKKKWNVYAKAPFGSPAAVVEYLGRYTHKIAITRHRILRITDTHIAFRYKDYPDGNKTKEMELCREEFLRRFEQHILPARFVKIRHYGYLQNRNKHKRLNEIRASMKLDGMRSRVKVPVEIRMLSLFGVDILKCPCCEKGRLVLVQSFYPCAQIKNKASPLGKRFEKH